MKKWIERTRKPGKNGTHREESNGRRKLRKERKGKHVRDRLTGKF